MEGWLKSVGYKCLLAATAEEGWRQLQDPANNVLVVITDVNMPGEYDGFGLLDRVIKQENAPGVIMMSGQRAGTALQGVKHGSTDFVPKPLVREVLLQKVHMIVRYRHAKWQLKTERTEKHALRQEVAQFLEQSFRTPVQIIAKSIASLLRKPTLDQDVRDELVALQTIVAQASNMRRPSLERGQFDDVTQSFLQNELSLTVVPVHIQPFPNVDYESCKTHRLTEWAFNVFEHTEDELLVLTRQMFIHLDMLTHFNIAADVLERFLLAVKQQYKPNPYHNWMHAVDVMQATFCFLTHFDGYKQLAHLDVLALFVAALCHDLGHPGVNNAHMILTRSDLAILYNGRTVLENFHAASLFQLISRHPETNIFASLNEQQFKDERQSIIECIIATDMAEHYQYVTRLRTKADSNAPAWNCEIAADRSLFMQCVMKMADISNVARPWDGSGFEWSRRATQEFFEQGSSSLHLFRQYSQFMQVTGKGNWALKWPRFSTARFLPFPKTA